jgi:hypothetical protein
VLDNPTLKMISLCVAGFGIFANLPVFWTLRTALLSGRRGRGRNLRDQFDRQPCGFAGPFAMGMLMIGQDEADRTRSRVSAFIISSRQPSCTGTT